MHATLPARIHEYFFPNEDAKASPRNNDVRILYMARLLYTRGRYRITEAALRKQSVQPRYSRWESAWTWLEYESNWNSTNTEVYRVYTTNDTMSRNGALAAGIHIPCTDLCYRVHLRNIRSCTSHRVGVCIRSKSKIYDLYFPVRLSHVKSVGYLCIRLQTLLSRLFNWHVYMEIHTQFVAAKLLR